MPLRLLIGAAVLLSISSAVPAADLPQSAAKVSFKGQVAPVLTKYCTGCHGGTKQTAGLALDLYGDEKAARKDTAVWQKVLENMKSREMPPKNRPQPSQEERDLIVAWINGNVLTVDCRGPKDPGRVTIRRLNRVEYNNTIRDLVGITFQPADDFPADDVGYGFDNIGDVLSLPPLLMEKYLAAAEKIVDTAFGSPELRKRIMICEPANEKERPGCAQRIIEAFAHRAYRRPLAPPEAGRLAGLVDVALRQGDSFETGIRLALQAVLVSPHFLFRIEVDRDLKNPGAIHPISPFELATRLSYFLWSSMPDDELFRLAREGKLGEPAVLEAQVRRMLKDPKSRALIENFAGQWLQLRNLATMTPDPRLFPTFDEALRSAMLKETEMFFEAILREDRSVLDFLEADFTFLNERLAKHYGIAGVKGDEFRRVTLTGVPRGGVLTQASVLTVTSNPTRTSPVKRGKWILENIFGTPPPPPPPDAPELAENPRAVLTGSLRQRMEQHRANPLCASCHQRMDPLGFGFENFDAIGAWRDRDGKFPIDPSGTLPGGQSFKGPRELQVILQGQKELFGRCLTEKMLTYALGRGLEPYDKCTVDEISAALGKNQYRISTLLLEIVKSDPFLKRRGKRGDQ